jgi:hypothetical protein
MRLEDAGCQNGEKAYRNLVRRCVGYSRLMGEDEVGKLERLKACRRELIDPAIEEFRGRVVKLMITARIPRTVVGLSSHRR